MAAILTSIKDLFASMFELVASVFTTAFHAAEGVVSMVINFFTGIFQMALDMLSGVIQAVGGVGKFIAGNIFVIGIIALGAVLYLRNQQQQGRTVKVGNKKLN